IKQPPREVYYGLGESRTSAYSKVRIHQESWKHNELFRAFRIPLWRIHESIRNRGFNRTGHTVLAVR
ncbi:MAG: hypothetical protein WAL07_06930, partial [Exiguobacterium chiriqhucha]